MCTNVLSLVANCRARRVRKHRKAEKRQEPEEPRPSARAFIYPSGGRVGE